MKAHMALNNLLRGYGDHVMREVSKALEGLNSLESQRHSYGGARSWPFLTLYMLWYHPSTISHEVIITQETLVTYPRH